MHRAHLYAEGASYIGGEYAYEVTQDGKPVHMGSVPELGNIRAFRSTPAQREQMQDSSQAWEFGVRVPGGALPEGRLENVEVTLYKVAGARGLEVTFGRLLQEQYPEQFILAGFLAL